MVDADKPATGYIECRTLYPVAEESFCVFRIYRGAGTLLRYLFSRRIELQFIV